MNVFLTVLESGKFKTKNKIGWLLSISKKVPCVAAFREGELWVFTGLKAEEQGNQILHENSFIMTLVSCSREVLSQPNYVLTIPPFIITTLAIHEFVFGGENIQTIACTFLFRMDINSMQCILKLDLQYKWKILLKM
jgi:hypothetical protein